MGVQTLLAAMTAARLARDRRSIANSSRGRKERSHARNKPRGPFRALVKNGKVLIAVKTWFITGTSRGFGREWAIAALDRGDHVATTARDIASLDDLVAKYGEAILPVPLDVTDRDADFAAVKLAHDYFGRLDVIVNNAGYGQFGMVEEISESEIRAQLETNLLGTLWVTQAALPYLREQGAGTSFRCPRSAGSRHS